MYHVETFYIGNLILTVAVCNKLCDYRLVSKA